jgi:anaerobic magnesium-protoporphyrin IX monomethyl ester cyclase
MNPANPPNPCHALLLQPPPGDVTGPYPALCYLKSYAAEHGFRVLVKDLGIEALHYLSHPERVAGMLELVRRRCDRMEAFPVMNAELQRQYAMLSAALSCCDNPRWFSTNFEYFQKKKTFFDRRHYRLARNALNAFFGMLSALHYPTALTAAEYPTATMLKTMDAILAHRENAVNPYVCYYEEVLFPLITELKPALVGISMVFANQSVQALVLGRLIKTRFPGLHVAFGGAYLSQWAMTAEDHHLAQLLGCADSIICGEGEQSFVELLRRVLKGETPAPMANLIYREEDSQRLVRCDHLKYTDIAVQPPPDFADLDLGAYLAPNTIIPYCVSRGCYWGRCVFCQNRYGDHGVRRYQTVPVDKAVAEMGLLADRYASNHFNFSNDVIDPVYLKNLSRAILDGGRSFVWNTDLRAEKAFDAETCRLMASAGLLSTAIGFESGCQKTLDAMDKGKRVEITADVMRNLYEAGVATQAMGIFGMPGESEADGVETVRFLESNVDHISYYVMGLLMVLPGSRMHRDPHNHGVTDISYAANPLNTPEPVWRSETRMSLQSVNRLYTRLSELEQTFAIDEYPYVGGLSTNHGFLYYTLGPDILKQLRRDELAESGSYYHWLGIDGSPPVQKRLKHLVPRLAVPFRIQRSRFPVHSFAMQANEGLQSENCFAGAESMFLLMPDLRRQPPAMIDTSEIRLIGRIDGHRTLASVLKKCNGLGFRRALSFIWYLVRIGVIDFIGSVTSDSR